MNTRCDRTEISLLLAKHFPDMPVNASSDDWHGFLDAITGFTTPLEMPNGEAFDRWRQALAGQGYPVWGYSSDAITAMQDKAGELKQAEALRLSKEPELLAALAKEAPLFTAAELLKPKP